jgi:hypothetical protein
VEEARKELGRRRAFEDGMRLNTIEVVVPRSRRAYQPGSVFVTCDCRHWMHVENAWQRYLREGRTRA